MGGTRGSPAIFLRFSLAVILIILGFIPVFILEAVNTKKNPRQAKKKQEKTIKKHRKTTNKQEKCRKTKKQGNKGSFSSTVSNSFLTACAGFDPAVRVEGIGRKQPGKVYNSLPTPQKICMFTCVFVCFLLSFFVAINKLPKTSPNLPQTFQNASLNLPTTSPKPANNLPKTSQQLPPPKKTMIWGAVVGKP